MARGKHLAHPTAEIFGLGCVALLVLTGGPGVDLAGRDYGQNAAALGLRIPAAGFEAEDCEPTRLADPDFRNAKSPIDLDGVVRVVCHDDLNSQVRWRIDAQVNLLLTTDAIEIGQVERFIALDTPTLGLAAEGRRTGRDTGNVELFSEHLDEIAEKLPEPLMNPRRRDEQEAPIQVDHP